MHLANQTAARHGSYGRLPNASDLSAATVAPAEIQDCYMSVLGENRYDGGWSENPNLDDTVYQQFAQSLASNGQVTLDHTHATIIGSNKLWAVLDRLCRRVEIEIESATGISRLGSSPRNHEFVSGGMIICGTGGGTLDNRIYVYGSKNRENLANEATYADKTIELQRGGHTYQLRAVSLRPGDLPILSIDGHHVSKERRLEANADIAALLQDIHTFMERQEISFKPEFFDRKLAGLSTTEVANLIRIAHDAFPNAQ